MKLVVGLGNPGPQYLGTRHNIGFEVMDRLSARLGFGDFDRVARSKFEGLTVDGNVMLPDGSNEKLLLLKPTTFMNLCGRAVQSAVGFYQIPPNELMIVLDDLALPCGRIRLRPGGSDGGHNGLRDIQRALGTSEYPRLRLGIDAPPPLIEGRDYVLGKFTAEQRKLIDPAVDRAAGALIVWIEKGLNVAMNQYNFAEDATDN